MILVVVGTIPHENVAQALCKKFGLQQFTLDWKSEPAIPDNTLVITEVEPWNFRSDFPHKVHSLQWALDTQYLPNWVRLKNKDVQ